MKRQTIDTAVFPVAGFGTRFLPVTKASPKEMLPVVDKPLIQIAVEEALAAGVKRIIFISGKGKRGIEDHFDNVYKLRLFLERQGKRDLLEQLDIIPEDVACIHIRQGEQMGLGAAVLCARPIVEDKPFALLLPDDFIMYRKGEANCTKRLIELSKQHEASVLAVTTVSDEEVRSYGIVGGDPEAERLFRVRHLVEKPDPREVSDRLGVVGRYVLSAEVFDHIERTSPGVGGEIQLTDAIRSMMDGGRRILAYEHEGVRYDCGSKIGYVCATCDYALSQADLRDKFMRHIKASIKDFG